MKKYLLFLFTGVFLFSTWSAYAQEGGLLISRGAGSFFIAIAAGIILAFAFQFILANLAVALGISAIGDIRKKGRSDSSDSGSSSESSGSTPTGVKISSAAGIFMLVTLSLSLFFASLIAVRLSLMPGNITGFTLGLVIWAGTFLLGVYIDSKLISGLSGSVFGLVKSAFSATASATGSLFGSSTESKMKHTAQETVKTIHKEIRDEYDLSGFRKKMDEYVSRLEPQRIDTDNLHQHMLDLINEIEVREKYTPNDPDASRRLFLDVAEKQKGLSGKDKEKLKNAFDEAREAFRREGSKADKAAVLADKLTPGDERQGHEYRMKVVDYLKKTRRQELDPDNLKEDLNEILNNPSAAPSVVKARVSQIDRATLKTALSTDGISEQQAEKVISTAEDVINKIKNKASSTQDKASKRISSVQDTARSKVSSFQTQESETSHEQGGQVTRTTDENKAKAESAIQNWFDRMGQPELEYDRLKADVEAMMEDPKAAPGVLKNRLKRLDRESLIALMSNNKRISRDHAEKAVIKIEEARDNAIRKAEEIENEVKLRLKKARNETLRQAEAARKTAAAAAWWLFAAAIVSGGASALGGILAYTF